MNDSDGRKPREGLWRGVRGRLTIGILLTVSVTAFEAMAVATVLPAASAALGGQEEFAWYAWVFSAFLLANLIGIPAAAAVTDRWGPSPAFFGGSVLFATGLAAAGIAHSMPALVAARTAQGFGAGVLSSVAYFAVAKGYGAADQPRMLALLASAWIVPGLLGPVLAALLTDCFGWRAVFFVMVPATAVAVWLAAPGIAGLGRTDGEGSSPVSRLGAALCLALGTGLALAGAEAPGPGAAGLGLGLGLVLALPALSRLLPAGTMKAAPGAPAALAAKFLVTVAFFGAEAFLPLNLTAVRGQSLAAAGAVLTAGTLAWTAGAWLQERMVKRVGRARLARLGLATEAVALAGTAWTLGVGAPVALVALVWAGAGVGIGLAYSSTTLVVLDECRGDEALAASSLQLVNVLGAAVGTGAGGALLAAGAALGMDTGTAIVVLVTTMATVALAALAASARLGTLPDPIRESGSISLDDSGS